MICKTCNNQARPTPCPDCSRRAEAARAVGDLSYRDSQTVAGRYHTPADPALAETYWPQGIPPLMPNGNEYRPGDTVAGVDLHAAYGPDKSAVDFVQAVLVEVDNARAKFPVNGSYITGLALGEESGEAQRALLHIHEGKGGEDGLYLECVQTAAMALRLATELQDRAEWAGNRRGCGGSYEVGSGGHVPGTPGEGCEACDRAAETASEFGRGPLVHNEDTGPVDEARNTPRFPRRAD